MRRCGDMPSHHVSVRAARCMLHIASGCWRSRVACVACCMVCVVPFVRCNWSDAHGACCMLQVRCCTLHVTQSASPACKCMLHLPGWRDACWALCVASCALFCYVLLLLLHAVHCCLHSALCTLHVSSCIVHRAQCRVSLRCAVCSMARHELVLCCMLHGDVARFGRTALICRVRHCCVCSPHVAPGI
jgi:hypothetical protein